MEGGFLALLNDARAPRRARWTPERLWGSFLSMRTDRRHRAVVEKIAEACTYVEAASAVGVS